MDSKIEMDRRRFLERFAKLSTATIMVGICVACPAPSEDSVWFSIIDIDGRKLRNITVSISSPIIYLDFYNPSVSLDNKNLITIKDKMTNTNISFTQEKIDKETLKLTLDTNELNYGSDYILNINELSKTFGFDTTPIQLSKEKLSLALDTQEEIIVEGLYVNHEMVSDFKILSVEKKSYRDYGDGQNGEVIASIENEIITIKGTTQGKVMLEVVVADKVEFSSYKANLFVEVV